MICGKGLKRGQSSWGERESERGPVIVRLCMCAQDWEDIMYLWRYLGDVQAPWRYHEAHNDFICWVCDSFIWLCYKSGSNLIFILSDSTLCSVILCSPVAPLSCRDSKIKWSTKKSHESSHDWYESTWFMPVFPHWKVITLGAYQLSWGVYGCFFNYGLFLDFIKHIFHTLTILFHLFINSGHTYTWQFLHFLHY